MDAYIYQAALWCGPCMVKALRQAGKASPAAETMEPSVVLYQIFRAAGFDDENDYDSHDLPKGPYDNGGGEADSPQHCTSCALFFENPLTTDGQNYVRNAVADYNDAGDGSYKVLKEWVDRYDYLELTIKERIGVWSVAVYLADRVYGGPEEGGWWYDTYEPVISTDMPLPRFTLDKEEAKKWWSEMTDQLGPHNAGRRPKSSVLSEGLYEARVYEGLPCSYPKERPHYE